MDFSSLEGIRTVPTRASTPTGTDRVKDINDLGQSDFMTMMLAQLKMQDPFKPTDNGEFLVQMAQLSTATGVTDLKSSIESLGADLRANQILGASTLVGRDVVVPAGTMRLGAGESVRGQVTLPGNADQVTVELLNASGETVQRQNLGSRGAGVAEFAFNGQLAAGAALPAGNYTLRVTSSSGGKSETLNADVKAAVRSVSIPAGSSEPQLHVQGMGTVGLSSVRQIGQSA